VSGAAARLDAAITRIGTRRVLWLVAGLALAVRVAFVIVRHRAAIGGDPQSYVFYGDRLSRGDGYDSYRELLLQRAGVLPEGDLTPTAFYAIGYPLILAMLFAPARWLGIASTPAEYAWVYGMFHAVLGALSAYLVAAIGVRVAGRRAGLLAGLAFALWPNLVVYTATAHVEPVYLFLVLAAAYVLLPALEHDGAVSTRRLVAAGAILGAAAQVRPLAAFLLPGLFLAFRLRPERWRGALRHTAVVGGLMIACVLPWTVRNAIVMPGFVLVTTGSGDALCMTRYDGSDGRFVFDSPGCLDDRGLLERPLDELEVEKNRENTSRAIEWVADHPAQELRLWFARGYWAFRDDHEARLALSTADEWRWPDLLPDLWYYVMLVLAVFGVRPVWRRWRAGAGLALGGVFAGAIVPILLFGDPRYKVPMLPFVAVLASAGAVRLARVARRRSPAGAVAA
jgi:4-amino-4-deoxy-L-arabinose transferase-like glycosyltransferase